MGRNPLDELPQVGRRRHFPAQPFAGGRVIEAEQFGVQGQARGAAVIRDAAAVPANVVDRVAANRIALLGQVNANLMRPPRLQPAGDAAVLADRLDRDQVRDGQFAVAFGGRRSTAAVAAIADQPGADRPRLRPAADHGDVLPIDRVRAELPAEHRFPPDATGRRRPDRS